MLPEEAAVLLQPHFIEISGGKQRWAGQAHYGGWRLGFGAGLKPWGDQADRCVAASSAAANSLAGVDADQFPQPLQ